MKKTEFNELKSLEISVLIKRVLQAKEEFAGLVLDKNMKQLKDKKQLSKKKKDIAQMMTVIRQKQMLLELEPKEAEEKENKNMNVERKARTRPIRSTTKSRVVARLEKSK